MSKSQMCDKERELLVRELSKVYAAIFQDLAYAYPDDVSWFEKDQARLHKFVEQRGPFQVFLVDLPALGKALDRALSNSAYGCTGLPLQGKGPGHVQMPQFLRQLYLRVFDKFGSLKEDYDVQAIFFLRQILFGAKRTSVQCSDVAVEKEINNFIEVDASLPEPESFWTEENPASSTIPQTFQGFGKSERYSKKVLELPAEERSAATNLLGNLDKVSRLLTSDLGDYDPLDWPFKHGPGVIAVPAPQGFKYHFRTWPEKLQSVYPLADCGHHDYMAWVDSVKDSMLVEKGLADCDPTSRLIDVPKTFLKPRLIAAEPGEHQWCQQNLKAYMYSRVRKCWIGEFVRFNDQTLNQDLCILGSRDGSLATVDLSAASDRVSCHAVGNFWRFRQEVLQALRASRTPSIEVRHRIVRPGQPSVQRLPLRKFSTMGNACTFPVESLMFLAVALAAVLTTRKLVVNRRNISDLVGSVAVFGDDIIVPIDSRELLVRGLEILDFKVNADKTFWTGRFRESCGVDSYAGIDVTPAYYKSPYQQSKPESLATALEVSNNFYSKFLVRTSAAVASSIPSSIRKDVAMVPMGSGQSGLKSFVVPRPGTSSAGKQLRSRFNRALQKMEWRAHTLSCKSSTTSTTSNAALLQFFTEDPDPSIIWRSGVKARPRLKEKAKYLGAEAWVSS